MDIAAIVYFLAVSYGCGASILRFFKEAAEPFEKHSIRVGVGLAVWLIAGIFIHLIGIPLNWWVFLIALPLPLWDGFKWYKSYTLTKKEHKGHGHAPKFKLKKSSLYALGALVIVLFCLFMYTKGAFSYTHLEDGDPWHHAMSAKYVAQEKILYTDVPKYFRYLDAYPPGYALVMGMTYQISNDMVWNLKFFNALIISLGILFFFFVARKLFDDKIAITATAILALVPAYFSHFIWSHTLSVALFFPMFYAALQMEEQKKWWIPLALVIGGIMMTQPSHPIKGLVMLGCLSIAHSIHNKKVFKYYVMAVVAGIPRVILSALLVLTGMQFIAFGFLADIHKK